MVTRGFFGKATQDAAALQPHEYTDNPQHLRGSHLLALGTDVLRVVSVLWL